MLTTSDKKNLIQNIDTVYSIIMPFYYLEKFEDTKGIIRIRKLKTERQHNDPKKKDQRTNNDQQNTLKTKDRVAQTPLKTLC